MELLEIKSYRIGQINNSLSNKLLKKYLWHQESEQQARRVYLLDQKQEVEEVRPIVTPIVYQQYFTVNQEILHFNQRHIEKIYAYYLMAQGMTLNAAFKYVNKNINIKSSHDLITKQYKKINKWLEEHLSTPYTVPIRELVEQIMMSYSDVEKEHENELVQLARKISQANLIEEKILEKQGRKKNIKTTKLEINEQGKAYAAQYLDVYIKHSKDIQEAQLGEMQLFINLFKHIENQTEEIDMSLLKAKVKQLELIKQVKSQEIRAAFNEMHSIAAYGKEQIVSENTFNLQRDFINEKIRDSESKQVKWNRKTLSKPFIQKDRWHLMGDDLGQQISLIRRLEIYSNRFFTRRLMGIEETNNSEQKDWEQVSRLNLHKEMFINEETQEQHIHNQSTLNQLTQNQFVQKQLIQNQSQKEETYRESVRSRSEKIYADQLLIKRLMGIEETNNSEQKDWQQVSRLSLHKEMLINEETQEHLLQQLEHLIRKESMQNEFLQDQSIQEQHIHNQSTLNQLTQNQFVQKQLIQNQSQKEETYRKSVRSRSEKVYADQLFIKRLIGIEEANNSEQKDWQQVSRLKLSLNKETLINDEVQENLLHRLDQLIRNQQIQNQSIQNQLIQDQLIQNRLIQNQYIQNQLLQKQSKREEEHRKSIRSRSEKIYANQLHIKRLLGIEKTNNSEQKDWQKVSRLKLNKEILINDEVQEHLLQQLGPLMRNQLIQNQSTQKQLMQDQFIQKQLIRDQSIQNLLLQNQSKKGDENRETVRNRREKTYAAQFLVKRLKLNQLISKQNEHQMIDSHSIKTDTDHIVMKNQDHQLDTKIMTHFMLNKQIEYIDVKSVPIVYQEKEEKMPIDKPKAVETEQPDIEFKRIETKTKTLEKHLEDEVSIKTINNQFKHLSAKANDQTIVKDSQQIINQQTINLISDKVYAKLQQRLKIEQLKRGL